jgi:GNAT superfamily N-acetyltransferase
MSVTIRQIAAAETYPIRLPILRPGMTAEAAIFPNDDAPDTLHLGAFLNEKLVGITSLYPVPLPEQAELLPAWQLRGMATLPEVRGLGCGSALVQESLARARAAGVKVLWCNARTPAVAFYKKHGLSTRGEEFEIPTAGPHYRMWVAVAGGPDRF